MATRTAAAAGPPTGDPRPEYGVEALANGLCILTLFGPSQPTTETGRPHVPADHMYRPTA